MLGSKLNIFNYRSFVLVMVIAIFFGNLVLILDSRDDQSSQSTEAVKSVINEDIIRSIQVTGSGNVSTEPDIATFSINILIQRDSASLAREDSARKLNQLFASLKSFGIDQKDIATTNYSLYPEYVYEKNKIRRIEAFNVSNNLNVKVRQLDKLGSVIDGVIKLDSGDIRINNVFFDIDDSSIYEDPKIQVSFELRASLAHPNRIPLYQSFHNDIQLVAKYVERERTLKFCHLFRLFRLV